MYIYIFLISSVVCINVFYAQGFTMKIKFWKNVFYLKKIQIVYFQTMILHKMHIPDSSFFFTVYISVVEKKIMQIRIFTFCKLMNNFTTTICSSIRMIYMHVCICIYLYIYTHIHTKLYTNTKYFFQILRRLIPIYSVL